MSRLARWSVVHASDMPQPLDRGSPEYAAGRSDATAGQEAGRPAEFRWLAGWIYARRPDGFYVPLSRTADINYPAGQADYWEANFMPTARKQ